MRKLLLLLLPVIMVVLVGCKSDDSQKLTIAMPKFDCSTAAVTSQNLTIIDTMATPRADRRAEILALEASGEFIAPERLYQRVSAELTTLNAIYAYPANGVSFSVSPCYNSGLTVILDEASYDAAELGNYTAWDALNSNLRMTELRIPPEDPGNRNRVNISLEGRYNMPRVAAAYAALPGVASVSPNWGPFTADAVFDTCLSIRGNMHYYITQEAECMAGCLEIYHSAYLADASGNIFHLGNYVFHYDDYYPDIKKPPQPPEWFFALKDCRAYLVKPLSIVEEAQH